MFGGIAAFLTAEISGVVKRNLTVLGLYGFGAFLILCAGGYALAALHTVLMLRYGAAAASLWIAGGLFVAGLIAFGVAAYVKSRRRPPRPIAQTALVAAPIAARLLGSRIGWKAGLAGVAVVLAAVLGKQALSGDGDEGES
jgi:hypothetical protein